MVFNTVSVYEVILLYKFPSYIENYGYQYDLITPIISSICVAI